jgi:hypothetical protein
MSFLIGVNILISTQYNPKFSIPDKLTFMFTHSCIGSKWGELKPAVGFYESKGELEEKGVFAEKGY